MVPALLSSDRLPGLLVVLAGISLILVAGAQVTELSRDKHTYEVSTFADTDRGIYEYESLSAAGKQVVSAALNGTKSAESTDTSGATETTISIDALRTAPEFTTDDGWYLLKYNGTYYCLDMAAESADQVTVSLEARCSRIDRARPVVHDFQSLTAEGQQVFRQALNAADQEYVRYGQTPPDFETGADAPRLNQGYYYISYNSTYYRLSVDSRSGFGVGYAIYFFLLVGVTGMAIVIVGAESAYHRRTRLPTVILAGLGILIAWLSI